MAARYTDDRASNFDIYLPNWLASHNKAIFGTLFVVNELIVLWCWLKRPRLSAANERRHPVMQVVKAGVLYFALVFGAGFVLGTIRTLWVVPRFGTRMAELMEMPIMLVVTIVAARWTVLRLSVPMMWSARLEMGCIALVLMLIAEFGFVLWIRGLSIKRLSRYARPCVGSSLLPPARCVCHHAASRVKDEYVTGSLETRS